MRHTSKNAEEFSGVGGNKKARHRKGAVIRNIIIFGAVSRAGFHFFPDRGARTLFYGFSVGI
jgi:hypothetical protein